MAWSQTQFHECVEHLFFEPNIQLFPVELLFCLEVFSDARKDGGPDAVQRLRDMMMLATRVDQLVRSPLGETSQTPAATFEDGPALKVSVEEAELKLSIQWPWCCPFARSRGKQSQH